MGSWDSKWWRLRIAVLLRCVALHLTLRCVALRCAASRYTALRCVALHRATLRCAASRYTALRCVALHRATLRCAASRYAALRCFALRFTVSTLSLRYRSLDTIIISQLLLVWEARYRNVGFGRRTRYSWPVEPRWRLARLDGEVGASNDTRRVIGRRWVDTCQELDSKHKPIYILNNMLMITYVYNYKLWRGE